MRDRITSPEIVAAESLGPFSDAEMLAYLEASGDDNPVHRDDHIAAVVGFAKRPLPGMMLMAHLERLVEAIRQGQQVTAFACRFLNSVPVGTAMAVSASCAARHDDGSIAELHLALSVRADVAVMAQVRLGPPGD